MKNSSNPFLNWNAPSFTPMLMKTDPNFISIQLGRVLSFIEVLNWQKMRWKWVGVLLHIPSIGCFTFLLYILISNEIYFRRNVPYIQKKLMETWQKREKWDVSFFKRINNYVPRLISKEKIKVNYEILMYNVSFYH